MSDSRSGQLCLSAVLVSGCSANLVMLDFGSSFSQNINDGLLSSQGH